MHLMDWVGSRLHQKATFIKKILICILCKSGSFNVGQVHLLQPRQILHIAEICQTPWGGREAELNDTFKPYIPLILWAT